VFDPKGESLGYLRPDAQLVVQPGYTSNLTRPFPAKLVQLAMARIEEKNREEAVPVFDVNGAYVGYLAGPAFRAEGQVAQAQVAQAQLPQGQIAPAAGAGAGGAGAGGAGAGSAGASTILGMSGQGATAALFGGGLVLGVAGVSAAGISGAFNAATPTGPNR
jgi:hypothetical protein